MERIGVVDIGSNTVRLVVYDIASHLPVPMFNEKASCRLGAGLPETGKLNSEGVEQAVISIDRFVRLSRAMSVDALSLVATAAVRDAEDGPAFTKRIEDLCNVEIEVLSGAEEAQLAAIGVMNGVPEANGIVCDLGGGSLDLVHVEGGTCLRQDSMPFGHLRLHELSGGKVGKAAKLVESAIQKADWVSGTRGQTIYAVGGSIRALARLHIEQTNYPLHIVDNFTMRRNDAKQLAELVSNLSAETLRRIPSVPSKRVETLPMAAVVFNVLLDAFAPKSIVFSAFGMREGKMITMIPKRVRAKDPLIAACTAMEPQLGRFSLSGKELETWMRPLFKGASERSKRNRLAACLLSDIGWHEHPDYRAEHAFLRVLRLPFAGLQHADRIFIATAMYVRYGGNSSDELPSAVLPLVSDEARADAELTGFALRLGHRLAGSAPGLLSNMPIKLSKGLLTLSAEKSAALINGEAVERRVKNLAQSLGVEFKIEL
ncbi:MAG: Ppx/GppA family phosphatase [Rhodospirillales bacterium]